MWPYGFVFSPRKRSDILCDASTLAAALTNLSTTSMSKQKRLSMESVFLRMQDLSLNISAWLRTRPFWKGGRHTEQPLVRIHNEVKNDCSTVLAVLIVIYTLNECTSLSAMAFRLIVNDTNLFIWAPTKPETQYCSAKSYISFLQLFPCYLWSRTFFSPHRLTLSKDFPVPNLYFFQPSFPSEGKLSYRPRGGSLFHPHRLYLLIPSSHFVIRICNHRRSRRVLEEAAGKKKKKTKQTLRWLKNRWINLQKKNMTDMMSLDAVAFIIYNKITHMC